MGITTGIIKYTLFIFNTIWAILGILTILFAGLGWDAMPPTYAIGIMILGGVIVIACLFGCFGAIRESSRLLWTYVVFLLIFLIVNVVFVIFSTPDVFKKYALKGVEEKWEQEIIHPGSMDTMQRSFACCGRESAEDYVIINRLPPSSCCKDNNCINPLNLYITGCVTKVEEAFFDEAETTRYFEWSVIALDVIVLVLAALLAIHYRSRERRFNY